MDNNMLVIGLLILVAIAVAVWLAMRKRDSEKLQKQFGPEYGRAVSELGSRPKAESELRARQKRVEQLHLVALSPAEADRFSNGWKALQLRFVDNPRGVLVEADQLVRDLMQARGYPMGDFDRAAADISVDHPSVVEHYRAAHEIAQRDQRGEVDTEGQRQAVIHYRALFSELLEVDQPQSVNNKPLEARS